MPSAFTPAPTPGGQLRCRLRHAADEVTQNRRAHDAVDTQGGQFLDQTQLRKRMERHMLDPYRAGLRQLQGLDIDRLDIGTGRCRLHRWAAGNRRDRVPDFRARRPPDQLAEVALCKTFNVFRAGDGEQGFLRLQKLLQAAAQERPVVPLDGKVAAEIEEGDLPHPAADALAAHQSEGEVALSRGLVVGAGLPDEHAPDATRKASEKLKTKNDYGTTKRCQNRESIRINDLPLTPLPKSVEYDLWVLKGG